jgi:hypothetical protein
MQELLDASVTLAQLFAAQAVQPRRHERGGLYVLGWCTIRMKSPAKHDVLLWMKSSEPNLWTRPESVRSPETETGTIRMRTQAATADGPTVGANCRGVIYGRCLGWLF